MDKTRKPYPQKGADRIKAALLMNKLQAHVLDGTDMSQTQIRAAEILLKKVMPDLKAVEHSGNIGTVSPDKMTEEQLDAAIEREIARTAEREEKANKGKE